MKMFGFSAVAVKHRIKNSPFGLVGFGFTAWNSRAEVSLWDTKGEH